VTVDANEYAIGQILAAFYPFRGQFHFDILGLANLWQNKPDITDHSDQDNDNHTEGDCGNYFRFFHGISRFISLTLHPFTSKLKKYP
jgi:hypothetical protein